jgi:hypothetical protein
MATGPEMGGGASGGIGKLLVPAAITAAGGALGFLLTKKQNVRAAAPKLREAVSDLSLPDIREGPIGDLTGDLRGKLDEVLGKEPAGPDGSTQTSGRRRIDYGALDERRRARRERRNQRRQRSGG